MIILTDTVKYLYFFFFFKIIEVGLCEVFELIKETRFSHPSLCLRSLQALLNVLQGQQPEGLQSEPPEVLGNVSFFPTTLSVAGFNKKQIVFNKFL